MFSLPTTGTNSSVGTIMQRVSKVLIAIAGLALVSGCTTKDVEIPQLAGPSTLAYSISLTADPDTISLDGVSSTRITIDARDGAGQPISGRRLRAQILVDNIPQDYGTLSTKTPTTGSIITYTSPGASSLSSVQTTQTVTIAVTPTDQGDFVNEFSRKVDIHLIPVGVIQPSNPNLVASFTFTPVAPQAFQQVAFDASATTNGGTACNTLCSYTWNFGDGTSGSGIATSHEYRTVSTFQATLTVTDTRGAQATTVRSIPVGASTPPTVSFTFSPTPAVVDQLIFFNAGASRPAPGRTLVSYDWNFGKGTTGTGQTVSKAYDTEGTYTVTLKVTDDAGAFQTASQTVVVTNPQPKPDFTILPASPAVSQQVIVNASSTTGPSPIVSYAWSFGLNSNPTTGSGISSGTTYSASGTKVITLTVTDSAGRTATISKQVVVVP